MDEKLTLCSLFDGSGGFCLAGLLAGIQPVSCSEIEPFPIRVTTKRLPFVKHLGDINGIHGNEIEPVDIITFGSPCTDMSVAGKRAGLGGKQSSLFYEAVRIIKEMRCATDGKYPRFIVWENVPGAFSSNKGEDFRCVLEEVCSVKDEGVSVPGPPNGKWPNAGEIVGDGYSVAFRQIDAQLWGVPQRRKRIYLVADFAGWGAGKILFESEGVSGYSAEGFRAWQGAARHTEEGAGAAGGVREGVTCLCDQGGQRMDVMEDAACTLRAEAHHPPCVLDAAGFCTEHSAQARGIGYEEETSPTLRAGTVPAAVMFENHSQDTRYTGPLETAPTVSAIYGMGGNNQPFVAEPDTPKTMKVRAGKSGGGKGILVQEDKSATLSCNNDQTVFVPVQAYGICSKESNAMKSDNPHSGFYEAATARTLDCNCGNPSSNQGGIAVVEPEGMSAFHINQRDEVIDLHGKSGALMATRNMQMQTFVLQGSMIGRDDKNGPQGSGINEDVSFTLDVADRHAVAYCMTTGEYAQFLKEKAPTLLARDYKDPPIVNDKPPQEPYYIVRRLTPTECAKLQGFPSWWCSGLGIEDPTGEEIEFWMEVWETHRKVMGTSKKPKTEKQIRKWMAAPYSDSAEYRLWGNGIALPCAYFVLAGIAWAAQREEETE